jgi:hypothetical protein
MRVNIKCTQEVTYDQEVEMSEEDFTALSGIDYDVYENSDPGAFEILSHYINFHDVCFGSDYFESVQIDQVEEIEE